MKLDEFFTPSEMNDGLTSVSRVEKLVTLMQQDKFHIANNIAEATHYCSTVAIVLSATQNTDCLRQFIQLGGLRYLDKWFQVLIYNDKSADEVITIVLQALEKIAMDQEVLESCGIGNALEHLHSHKNLEIQGRARKLFNGCEKIVSVSVELQENVKGGLCHDHESRCMAEERQGVDGEHSNFEKASMPGEDSAKGEAISCSEAPVSGSASAKEVTDHRTNSEVLTHSLETVKSTTHISLKNETGLDPDQSFEHVEIKKLDVGKKINEEANNVEDGSMRTVAVDFYEKQRCVDIPYSMVRRHVSVSETDPCNADVKVKGNTTSISFDANLGLQKHPPMNLPLELVDDGSSNYWKKIMEQKLENQTDGSKAMKNAAITFLGNQNNLGEIKHDLDSFRTDDSGKELYMNIKSGPRTNADEKSAIEGKISASNLRAYQPNAEEIIRKTSEVDLAYEEDALEVARLVAKEVEQEVGIYREASCSSYMKDMDCETVEMATADSMEVRKNEYSTEIKDKSESCTNRDIPDSCCSTKEEVDLQISAGSDDLCVDAKDMSQETCATTLRKDERLHEQELSQLTTVPHEPADSERTYPCTFDLNEDAQTEEIECPDQSIAITVSTSHVKNLSAPIPVVATSRGPVGLPGTPLLFEGELGWRGSAATSAFRPALTRRTPDKDRACSTEENKCNSKNLQCFHGIDLNVADASDNAAMDLFLGKHVPVSSSLPSGESSVEISSKRAERLNLDLNRLGDNDDNCKDLLSDHHLRNETCSPSLSSLSRPSMRDFDLNDNPSIGEAHVFERSGQGSRPSRSWRLDDPVVSILGTRIQLEPNMQTDLGLVQDFGHSNGRKEFLNHPQSFLMSAPGVVPSVGQMGRVVQVQPTLGYTVPPAFPYNGLGLGTIPLPSTVYASGAVSYMVDSRGAAVIPQMLGSSSTHLSFPRSPYLMGVAGAPGPNDIGILRPNLDLNAGLTSLDADAREGGHMRHMFFPTNNSLVEEQMKSFQQVSMSGPSLKRKEPDCGWDPYQVGYKQATSWH